MELLFILVSVPLRVRGIKWVPCYLFLYFLEKKISHAIWLVAVLFSYAPIFLSFSSGFWATDAI